MPRLPCHALMCSTLSAERTATLPPTVVRRLEGAHPAAATVYIWSDAIGQSCDSIADVVASAIRRYGIAAQQQVRQQRHPESPSASRARVWLSRAGFATAATGAPAHAGLYRTG